MAALLLLLAASHPLLEAAAAADGPAREACLRAWAAAPDRGPPDGRAARAALEEADRRGRPRVFGALDERGLRVGQVDPMGVLGRVEVVAVGADGQPVFLVERSFGQPRPLPPGVSGPIEVVGYARDCLDGQVLARARIGLGRPAAPPPPPPPPQPETKREEAVQRPTPWWWWLALAVAAFGLTAAAAEELGRGP